MTLGYQHQKSSFLSFQPDTADNIIYKWNILIHYKLVEKPITGKNKSINIDALSFYFKNQRTIGPVNAT